MRVPAKTYTDEFKADAVNILHRGDRSFRQLAEDLGVSSWTLRYWYKKDQMAKGSLKKPQVSAVRAGETPGQKVVRLERELARLQRENDSLRMDREILKKAAAFFAKESE
jgi:transposase